MANAALKAPLLYVATAFRLKAGCEEFFAQQILHYLRRNRLSAEGWL